MPAEIQDTWVCYRMVQEGLATMHELSTTLSIDDVDLMVIAQNVWHDQQQQYARGEGTGAEDLDKDQP